MTIGVINKKQLQSDKKEMDAAAKIKDTLVQFRSEFKVLGIVAFVGIFTWNFIRALQLHLFNPLIRAYILHHNVTNPKIDIKIRGGQVLMFSALIPEVITYFILIITLFFVWAISRQVSAAMMKSS